MEHTEVNSQDLPQAEEAYLQALFYELLHLLLQRHMRRRKRLMKASTDEVRLAYIRSSLKSSYAPGNYAGRTGGAASLYSGLSVKIY